MSKKLVKIIEVMLAVLLAVCGVFACAKMLFNNNAVASADENDGIETVASGAFDGGSGTSSSPYLISSSSALSYFLNDADTTQEKYYKLTTNITYSGDFKTKRLYGYLNGGGYTITMTSVTLTSSKPALFSVSIREISNINFVISSLSLTNSSGTSYAFLVQQNVGTINKVKVTVNSTVTTPNCQNFGLVAGTNDGTINSSTVIAKLKVDSTTTNIGGIVGQNTGTLYGCGVTKDITVATSNSNGRLGGVCGYSDGTISACSYGGTLTVNSGITYGYVGGILGKKGSSSSFDSYNHLYGTVTINGTVTSYGDLIGG